MKLEKKHFIVGGIGVVSVSAAILYWQYTKLMNYCIGLNSIKINKVTQNAVDVNIFLNFKNNSNLKLEIQSQEYAVYVSGKKVVGASNFATQVVSPESMSVIGVNVKFNPEKSGQKILDTLFSANKIMIKVDVKLKVKLWFFTVNIPYVYESSLKDLMAPSKEPKSSMKCK